MTPSTAERPQMPVEDFEELERQAPETVRLEYANGKPEVKGGRYQQSPSYPWGATVEIPSPVNITLSTEKLKDYAD